MKGMTIEASGAQWRITLKDGQTLGIWATVMDESDDHYTFEIMISGNAEQRASNELVITATTPTDPDQVVIAVARIPKRSVAKVETESWDSVATAS